MKYFIIFFLISIHLVSCKNEVKEENSSEIISEELTEIIDPNFNIIVKDTVHEGEVMLLGKVNRKGLELEEVATPYKEGFEEHILDTASVKLLEPLLNNIKLKVFIRSCCSDSQIHIPALYKILDLANFNYDNLEMVALSHNKDTPDGLEEGYDIEYVPTIIVYKDQNEIGRFVEMAQETLEKDLLAIINETGYKHAYED